jgi:methionyl-tRNA synthetase
LGEIAKADLKNIAWGGLKPGTRLGELGPVFPRAEKDAVTRMKEIEERNAPAVPAEEAKAAPVERKTDEKQPGKKEPHGSRLQAALDGLAVAVAESTNETAAVLAVEHFVKDNLGGGSANPARGTAAHHVAPASTTGAAPASVPGADSKISIDDFGKVELRVAQIKVAERVPKADKLLRLEVDLGYEQRQILAGIAEAYTPESLVGRKIVIVANLAPRKLRGLESNGMLLAASLEGGKPVLAGFLEDVEIGARLK